MLPYCWECETPLSNFETRQDDSYRDRTDPAVTVALRPRAGPRTGPSCSGGRARRARLDDDTVDASLQPRPRRRARALLRRARHRRPAPRDRRRLPVEAYEDELAGAELVGTVKGAELVGRSYRPLFDYFADTPGAFVVLGGDFVTTDEGHRDRPHGAGIRRGRPTRL